MKIAIVGIGYWGSKLLRNLVSIAGPANVIAVDEHVDRIATACAQYPGLEVAHSLDLVLRNPDVRGVVIATPAETHSTLARRVLHAKRHVLVEKPLANSTADAQALVDLAERNDVALMVGHTFLFSPRVQWICDYVAGGHMGRVHYLSSSRLNLGRHNTVTNVLWDLCPHDFSIAFQVLGEFPIAAQAYARSMVQPDVPDVAFVSLQFPSGTIASVDVSWLAPKKIRNTVIVGDNSMIVYDDNDAEEPVKLYDKGVVVPESDNYGANQLTYRYGNTIAPHIPVNEPLSDELTHFVHAVQRNSTAVRSDGQFALEVVRALEAADQSWRNGGHPVEIPQLEHDVVELRSAREAVAEEVGA
jgi:predicted dehydrogenase